MHHCHASWDTNTLSFNAIEYYIGFAPVGIVFLNYNVMKIIFYSSFTFRLCLFDKHFYYLFGVCLFLFVDIIQFEFKFTFPNDTQFPIFEFTNYAPMWWDLIVFSFFLHCVGEFKLACLLAAFHLSEIDRGQKIKEVIDQFRSFKCQPLSLDCTVFFSFLLLDDI